MSATTVSNDASAKREKGQACTVTQDTSAMLEALLPRIYPTLMLSCSLGRRTSDTRALAHSCPGMRMRSHACANKHMYTYAHSWTMRAHAFPPQVQCPSASGRHTSCASRASSKSQQPSRWRCCASNFSPKASEAQSATLLLAALAKRSSSPYFCFRTFT